VELEVYSAERIKSIEEVAVCGGLRRLGRRDFKFKREAPFGEGGGGEDGEDDELVEGAESSAVSAEECRAVVCLEGER